MKICVNGITRDMTAEEELEYLNSAQTEEAGPEDYENALSEMGVDFSD